MREIAKQILLDVHAANNTHFLTEYDSRLHKIDAVLDGCSVVILAIGVDVPHVVGVVGVRGAEPPVGGGNELYPVVIQGGGPPWEPPLHPRLEEEGTQANDLSGTMRI